MDADLSDEEFLLPDTQLNFALKMPSLAQDVADAKLDSDRPHTGNKKTPDKCAPVHRAPFGKFAFHGSSKGNSGQGHNMAEVILISPPSSDKPVRPKRRHGNAQIFDSEGEDEHESDLDKPVAKRLRQVPAEVQEAEEWQEIPEPDIIIRRRRMHVQPDASLTGREHDMIQQLQKVGQELQDDEIDAVLERCEQLSLKLREALQTHGTDRFSAPDTAPSALISHATLVAACGEAAKYFKPYQMVGVNFLMLLKRQSISGSILADEMGLGKTAQAICFLGVLKHVDQDSGPHLVVVPASLLENWQRELRRWCSGLRLVTYYGKDRAQLSDLNHPKMQSSLQASTAASARAVCQHTGGVDRARLIPRSSLWNKRIRTQCMHRPQFRTHIIAMAGQNGGSSEQALVIGAGIAGLSCGLKLQKAGIPFTILESSDGPGGRVRSDKVEGFTLDRGFQIFLTSYPEAKEVLDYADLDLKPFYAGAYVHYKNKFHKVADPLRHPLDGVQSLFNSTGTIGDKLNVGAFRLKSELGSLEDLLQRDETTTMERLKKEGFTDAIIDRFFKPFLGGIFFDKELNVTSRLFEFVMRMLASGENSLPANGIGAISEQMAAALPAGSIKTGARVMEVTSSDTESPPEVTLEDGSKMTAKRGIVVATDQPSAAKLLGQHLDSSPSKEGKGRGTCNLYFKTSQKPPHGNVLYLNGTGSGRVNNACFPSSVAPSYAPSGQHLVSVSIIGSHDDMTDDTLSSAVHQEMSQWFGAKQTDDWKLLRVYRVPFAQPNQEPPTDLMRPVQLGGRLYVCGDHRDHATLDGALKSGRRAAEALIADTVQETTSNGAPSEPVTVDQTELA